MVVGAELSLQKSFVDLGAVPKVRVPPHYWSSKENQRKFLLRLGQTLKLSKLSDWTSVNTSEVAKHGGSRLLVLYNGSLVRCLQTVFPEEPWNPWNFVHVPKKYWSEIQNQRAFLTYVGNSLKLENLSDWTSVSLSTIREHGGSRLLEIYNGSLIECLRTVFPSEKWSPLSFSRAPKSYWNDFEHLQTFLNDFAAKNNVLDSADWTKVTTADLKHAGGITVIKKYGSASELLQTIFYDQDWDGAKKAVWRQNLDRFAKHHGITRVADWSRVSGALFGAQVFQGRDILRAYVSVPNALKSLYRERDWDALQPYHVSKPQQKIYRFLSEEGLVGDLNFKLSSLVALAGDLELDIYFPKERLAVEYQGQVHFSQLFKEQSLQLQRRNDDLKRQLCENSGITLVQIPYWWDGTKAQLVASVRHVRPDLLSNNQTGALPVGQSPVRLDHTALMLARDWTSATDPNGRMLVEKLDGVRAYWDGSHLFTRSGKLLSAPEEFCRSLPAGIALDGELWCRRLSFATVRAVARERDVWNKITFCAFDTPDKKFQHLSYKDRLNKLRELPQNRRFQVPEAIKCTGQSDLIRRLTALVYCGGEGFVLRNPAAAYEVGRSDSVLKVKPKFLDVVVVKRVNHSEYVLVQNSLGVEFKLNRPISVSRFPGVSVGSVISIQFSGLTPFGAPRFPIITSHHKNVKFSDVVHYFLSTNLGPLDLRFDKDNACRGCGKVFRDDEHRIQVKGLSWLKDLEEPTWKIFSFCPNDKCVRLGEQKDSRSTGIRYPKFAGRVGLALDLEVPFTLKQRSMLIDRKKPKVHWKERLRKLAEQPSTKQVISSLGDQGIRVDEAADSVIVNSHFCFVCEE
eukprot:TRINITY_DN6813_c0_g1_i1.p1 TRINITY_DN6813_c0_g1~~TRINITY_DN6813_c0_g1_i1.p1  ORF type:complete len:852 (-),score=159.44 TRINITY_DN6813_c0_g1_i1:14-2569(-)